MTRGDGIATGSHHWGTPTELFERLNEVYDFNLDPCAANGDIAKCPRYFTPVEDGLKQNWTGRVFLNPPYGRQIVRWMKKAAQEIEYGHAEVIVALLPASVGTNWFHQYVYPYAQHMWFVHGRLSFEDYTNVGKSLNKANFDSIIVEMRKPDLGIPSVSVWEVGE